MFSLLTDESDSSNLLPALETIAERDNQSIFHLAIDISVLGIERAADSEALCDEFVFLTCERRSVAVSSGRLAFTNHGELRPVQIPNEPLGLRLSFLFQPPEIPMSELEERSLLDHIDPVVVRFTIRDESADRAILDCGAMDIVSIIRGPEGEAQEVRLELGAKISLTCRSCYLPFDSQLGLENVQLDKANDSTKASTQRYGHETAANPIHKQTQGSHALQLYNNRPFSLDRLGTSSRVGEVERADGFQHPCYQTKELIEESAKFEESSLRYEGNVPQVACKEHLGMPGGTDEEVGVVGRSIAVTNPFHAITRSRFIGSKNFKMLCTEGAPWNERPVPSLMDCPKPHGMLSQISNIRSTFSFLAYVPPCR